MQKRFRIGGLLLVLLLSLPTFAQHDSSDSSRENAAAALKQFEEQLNKTTNSERRFHLLYKIAPTAFAAGELQKAKSYSNALLALAPEFPTNWHYGNAIHIGNLVLGRVALAEGDIAVAKAYLLASGQTPGSPQLNSFGPNMTLAQELLAKGEREVVLEYFHQCAVFWKLHNERLDNWANQVKRGETPNFGANLHYGTDFFSK